MSYTSWYNTNRKDINKNLARIEELERNCKGSFSKVENHVKRILKVIDKHTQMIEALEKKVESLDLEKKLKIDYMLKMNQLVENDKAHQAMHDLVFKQIAELKKDLVCLEESYTHSMDRIIESLENVIRRIRKLEDEIIYKK